MTPSEGSDGSNAVQRLITVAHEAFERNPGNCSGAVHYVITHLVNANEPYRTANDLMKSVHRHENGWRQVVTLEEASNLANQGKLVIAGLANPDVGKSGHVVVILPGPWKQNGGFSLPSGTVLPPGKLLSPPVMSTSSDHYAGAISDGDKTLFDAWGKDDRKNITLWTRDLP